MVNDHSIRVPLDFINMLKCEQKEHETTLYETLTRILRQRNAKIRDLENQLSYK